MAHLKSSGTETLTGHSPSLSILVTMLDSTDTLHTTHPWNTPRIRCNAKN
jgi:hypothetical protein